MNDISSVVDSGECTVEACYLQICCLQEMQNDGDEYKVEKHCKKNKRQSCKIPTGIL